MASPRFSPAGWGSLASSEGNAYVLQYLFLILSLKSLSSSPLNLCHNQTSSSSPPQHVVFTAIARVVTTIA
ncbi:hypothetical protein YC2023_072860 [Brassica napus]